MLENDGSRSRYSARVTRIREMVRDRDYTIMNAESPARKYTAV